MIFIRESGYSDKSVGSDSTAKDAGGGYHYYVPDGASIATTQRAQIVAENPGASAALRMQDGLNQDRSVNRNTLRKLDALAGAVLWHETLGDTQPVAATPELFSLTQFITQDITAGILNDLRINDVRSFLVQPQPRMAVVHKLLNGRGGAMDLSSVYGDGECHGVAQGAGALGAARRGQAQTLAGYLRDPHVPGKMTVPAACAEKGQALAQTTSQDGDALAALTQFEEPDAQHQHAAQSAADVQRLLLQFHNLCVDSAPKAADFPTPCVHIKARRAGRTAEPVADTRGDALYAGVRGVVRWHYQWLVVNDFLPRICHAETLEQIVTEEAPLYRHLAGSLPVGAKGCLPIPLEFAAAALRVGTAQSAALDLRRGYLLNLPTAQACIAGIGQATGITLPQLTHAQLTSGPTGAALEHAGFVQDTPLWFYLRKESELLCDGHRLGPLGTTLMANTLLGLLVVDESSYWNQGCLRGCGLDRRWHPRDGIKPQGRVIVSFAAMRAAVARSL